MRNVIYLAYLRACHITEVFINPLMPIIIVQHFYEFYTSKQLSRIHLTHRVTQIKILLINTENMDWQL